MADEARKGERRAKEAETLTIGALASASNMTAAAIRCYERIGVIARERASRRSWCPSSARSRLVVAKMRADSRTDSRNRKTVE
jgi:hypothetical protein